MTPTGINTNTRYHFLDWLRVLAIFLLLFYHTGMLFVGWPWHIQNAQTIHALATPMAIAHRLRMPLLFIIAGASMWFALTRRRGTQVATERTWRLLLPLIAGMVLIVPPQIYFERLYRGQWTGSYVSFLFTRVFQFRFYPQGDFGWHHLWFIAFLYAYALLLIPPLLWWQRRPTALRPGPWIYGLALPLCVNEAFLRPLFPDMSNQLADLYMFYSYFFFALYGALFAGLPGCWDWLATQRRYALGAGLAVLVAAMALHVAGCLDRDGTAATCVANVVAWAVLLAALGYARCYLSFENRLLIWARDASYPIYILHQTITVAIGYVVIQQPWTPWPKYWVVLDGTLASCVLIYHFGIRRFALTRILFGMKPSVARSPHVATQRNPRPAFSLED